MPLPTNGFLDERRLLSGPWQALERDVARLFLANGFDDVRIIGGTGDKGGDVLATRDNALWVVQCKFTSRTPPPTCAIDEVVEAAQYYKAQRLMVATSRPPADSLIQEKNRYERLGLRIDLAGPRRLLQMMERTPEYSRYPSRSAPLSGGHQFTVSRSAPGHGKGADRSSNRTGQNADHGRGDGRSPSGPSDCR